MEKQTSRLYFIDAMRAWAILMMLQGHFVDGMLDNAFRDNAHAGYSIWKYFRGMTAPVFFTVSGFIFTYLLVRSPQTGFENPRVVKGIKRGLELLFIGYLLRMNFMGILKGEIYASFYFVDVLHCIGLSIIGIIAFYLMTSHAKNQILFPIILVSITLVLFVFEPIYQKWSYSGLPDAFANYLTKRNGSVFTIIPWFGYTSFGAFVAVLFTRFKHHKNLYPIAITVAFAIGTLLILLSSDFFLLMTRLTGIQLFADIFFNNYLFIRLGDVLIVFALFMLIRSWLTNPTVLKIGQSTLSIYVVHFMILYGSFTGLGLYQYFHHSLTPIQVILGALAFMIVCSFTALLYESNKVDIKLLAGSALKNSLLKLSSTRATVLVLTKTWASRIKRYLERLFGLVKN